MSYKIICNNEKDRALVEFLIEEFEYKGRKIYEDRNTVKIFDTTRGRINVKSFKPPNLINKIVYNYIRSSKAHRSYHNALYLERKGIGTPPPIAYVEEIAHPFFNKSFYISKHIDYDITFRALIEKPNYSNREQLLKEFAAFTFSLHENRIHFLDHSPGNTLMKISKNGVSFFLIDLNRMKFEHLSFHDRIKNFERITPKKEMVDIMANEYSRLIQYDADTVRKLMWHYIQDFQRRYHKKRRLKKRMRKLLSMNA